MAGCLAGMALSSAWKNGTATRNNRNHDNGNSSPSLAIDIFERSPSKELSDRGLGIGLPPPIFKTLVDKGWVDSDMRYIETLKRQWLLKVNNDVSESDDEDTAQKYHGKVLYEPEMNIQLHNWGLLWQQFRRRIEDDDTIQYHTGVKVVSTTANKNDGGDDDVELFDEESQPLGKYSFVIHADGATSSSSSYAGYALWRGSLPAKDCRAVDDWKTGDLEKTFFTPVFPGGHGIFYLMPSTQDGDDQDEYLVNFGLYTATPPSLTEFSRVTRSKHITPEQRTYFEKTALSNIPQRFQDIVRSCPTEKIEIHPIVDRIPSSLVAYENGQGIYLGDSGCVLRPHTASGTTKAILEALLLEKLVTDAINACTSSDGGEGDGDGDRMLLSWEDVARKYNDGRLDDSQSKYKLGKRLGQAQVIDTPDWSTMGPSEFEEWLAAQVKDTGNYLYKNIRGGNSGEK